MAYKNTLFWKVKSERLYGLPVLVD